MSTKLTQRLLGMAGAFGIAASALAQPAPPPAAAPPGPKSINTGGAAGAYHSLFCPPIPPALATAYFQGYACTTSAGSLENINRVLAAPTQLGFAQFDLFAREAAARPDDFRRLTVIRQDLGCEGLWMITKNTALTGFGDVLGQIRRIPFLIPGQNSGSAASFAFLQANDPEGLGRVPASNVRYVADTTALINAIADSTDGAIGFFIQFPDPDNANIRLMAEKNLRIIPVASREILRTRIADQPVYEVQTYTLQGTGVFSRSRELTTACTPIALFTGTPEAVAARPAGGVTPDDQRDMITRVRALPLTAFHPQESRLRRLMSGARRLSGQAVEEMSRAAESTRRAVESRLN